MITACIHVFFLCTFPILSLASLSVSFVTFINQRGGKRYLGGIRYRKIRPTGRGASERKPEHGLEYLARWEPEFHCSMHIPGWISASKVVGGCTLDCIYKPTAPLWLDRQASWIRIQKIHASFLLDFTLSVLLLSFACPLLRRLASIHLS